MEIVTDSGVDILLDEPTKLDVHIVPLTVTLNGTTYREGIDIQPDDFYALLSATDNLPTTSQPSAGAFAETYRSAAATDPDILSIHMSSGLSGTFNAARQGAELVPEANVTLVDTKTLSAAAGWQVVAAVRARDAGWSQDEIVALIERLGDASDSIYTLDDLTYLIHGGRISHMKGLIASVLNLKPLIGVELENGTYEQRGRSRTFNRALTGLVDLMAQRHEPGTGLRVQVLHASNPDAAAQLRDRIDQRFDCTWLPIDQMSLVLGAHTGSSMVGVAYGAEAAFAEIP